METWRALTAEYTSQVLPKNPRRWWSYREYLGGFLERYILELNQPRDPRSFLHVDYSPPPIANIFPSDDSPLPLLYDFVKWILRDGRKNLGGVERAVDRSELRNPFVGGERVGNKSTDLSFSWLSEIHPDLDEWREVTARYIRTAKRGIQRAMCSLMALFSRVIVPNRSWWRPSVFLSRGNTLPAPTEWLKGSEDYRGVILRSARDFVEWVLANHLSVEDDNGRRVVPYELKNPFDTEIIPPGSRTYTESNKTPLPYRYIDECRRILKQGSSFREWRFAQRHIFATQGGDWFEVPFVSIDETDPNCVWEKREVNVHKDRSSGGVRKKRTAYFLWCPARAVALYIKLLLPLRTHQVRVLDSGEADTFRFSSEREKTWSLNTSPLAKGNEKRPHKRGVFRRFGTLDGQEMTGFYINTNKTADVGKDGASRGYFIPWQYDEALEWLAKLRDWQEKYNPIDTPTSWTSLDNRHIPLKSEAELLALGDTCSLFRDAAARPKDKQKPIPRGHVEPLWNRVCAELEERIYSQRTLLDGERIRFVKLVEKRNRIYPLSLFPLHSLRVSLLTLFALEGGVPIVYLSKLLAGHARLLMTIYYIKPGILEMTETMAEAITRIDDGQLDGEFRWLAEAAERDLETRTAYNDRAAIDAVLNGRSGAGWIWDAKGICPVGRARCDDGGPIVYGKDSKDRRAYAPVPGGSGNCVRCRFFITGPAFLPGLVTHQNLLLYRFGELGRRYQEMDERISNLKDSRDSTLSGTSGFRDEDQRELCRLEVDFERVQGEIDHVGRDVVATHRLVQRSVAILNHAAQGDPDSVEDDPTVALVAAGSAEDVRVSLQEVTELHQLSVLCENVVLYPESEVDSAIYRRSQLIDAALETRRQKPLLCRLSRKQHTRRESHDPVSLCACWKSS